jgi:hypothetical protein
MNATSGKWHIAASFPGEEESVRVLGIVRRFKLTLDEIATCDARESCQIQIAEARRHLRAVTRLIRPLIEIGRVKLSDSDRRMVCYHLEELERLLTYASEQLHITPSS